MALHITCMLQMPIWYATPSARPHQGRCRESAMSAHLVVLAEWTYQSRGGSDYGLHNMLVQQEVCQHHIYSFHA